MVERRPFSALGGANHGWLDAKHHFSFAGYHDPERMSWGALRVWNDDTIAPGTGFPPHPHSDMEIVTYVREGAITHRDNQGNLGRTEAGDVQVMSAGTGIEHSEFNLEPGITRLFQIWIMPHRREALRINADARVLGARLKAGESIRHPLAAGRRAYLVPSTGRVDVNGTVLDTRDGGAIRDEQALTITALEDAELVLVETA